MMKKAFRRFGMFAAMTALCFGASPHAARGSDPVVYGCVIKTEDRYDVKLPAKEAGVLVELGVNLGSRVEKDQQIGKIDDNEAQKQKEAADFARRAAHKKATDTVQLRYADKSAEVKRVGYEKAQLANKGSRGAVPEIEVMEKLLEWDVSILSAEKAKNDQELAKYEYLVKNVEFEAAEHAIGRRTIVAPFDGEVFEIFRDQDEWVNPGDPILRLVRLDTMLVEGLVEQALNDPHEIQNCNVTVEVDMARQRKEQFSGRIIHVSSEVRYDGKYVVRAEVANRREHDRWLLRNQMTAMMTIHLNTGGVAALDTNRAQ